MPEWSTCSIPLSSSESDPLTLAEALALADALGADDVVAATKKTPANADAAMTFLRVFPSPCFAEPRSETSDVDAKSDARSSL